MGWMELVDYLAVSKQMRAVEPDGALCSAPAKREVEMTDRALLQQALNALTGDPATRSEAYVEDVTDALRARLAEPDVAEPVAWRWRWSETEQWQYTNEWRDVPSSATDIEALYHAGLAELERGPIGEIERLRYTEKQMQKARDEIGLLRADCEDLRNELDRWKESNRAAIVEGGKLMEENERLREEVERLTSQRNDLMKAILRQSDEVGDEYRERHGTATTYESALQMLTSMNGEMERLYRLVERLRAQLELAESINKGTARQINRERANVAQLQAELNRRV